MEPLWLASLLAVAAAGVGTGMRRPLRAAHVCTVTDFGAVGDNRTLCTAAFRAASAACAGKGAPGLRAVVAVPAGVFLTGAFNISSHTELRLARGARIVAAMTLSRAQWPAVAPFPSYGVCNDNAGVCWRQGSRPAWCSARTQALVSAFGATNVAITGAGSSAAADSGNSVIDGQGCWWWSQYLSKAGLQFCRPQLVNFYSCTGPVEVAGVTLEDPPFWNLHFWNSSGIHVHDMRIHAAVHPSCPHAAGEQVRAVNSDGIDVDSSSDVVIERVYIEADDDAVAIKSGKDAPGRAFGVPSTRVMVRDSVLVSNDFAVGSECSGGCSDITLRDTIVSDANGSAINVLRLKSHAGRGGYLRNIYVKNVSAARLSNTIRPPDGFRFDLEGSGTPSSNITIEDVHIGRADGIAGQFFGDAANPMLGLTLRNVTVGSSEGGWVCRGVKGFTAVDVYPPVDPKLGCK